MIKYYTNSTIAIPAPDTAATLVYKSKTGSPVTVLAVDGFFSFTVTDPGDYFYQISLSSSVLSEGSLTVFQDLAHAPAAYDPRSQAEKTLEALDAKIAGRALTIQQSKITVGDKSIDYMNSIDELLRWRDHFQEIVNREKGHPLPKIELCIMRGS